MGLAKESLVIALSFHAFFAAALFRQQTNEPIVNRGFQQPGLRKAASRKLVITALADTDASKGAVTLKWTLTNISGKDVYVRETNLFLDYKITVRNSHNDPVRLTERGQQASTASYFSRRKTTILLRPRQETAKELQISDFYDMKTKGVYTIVIQRDVPSEDGKSSETIRSNAVKVKIGS